MINLRELALITSGGLKTKAKESLGHDREGWLRMFNSLLGVLLEPVKKRLVSTIHTRPNRPRNKRQDGLVR